MEKERKERMKRMTCKGIAGIVMMAIVVAFITVGITAVEATVEEPFSIEDCPNCPNSGMELYYRDYSLWILHCDYHNVVDSKDNSGTMHIFAFTNADDTESRFKRMRNDDLKTAERHYSNKYKILRNTENEFVWLHTSPGIISPDEIYFIIGYFLYDEKNRMTKVNIRAAIKDEKIAIRRFNALAECAKSVIDKKCGEKKEKIDLV
ncbi:MAG: hypothetical protein IMF19_00915, partial [Proteobacteria bacterium]|nr:hypothetical protein [Pseudomonadota bacterium]